MAYGEVNDTTAQEGILDAPAATWPHDPDALCIVALHRNKTGRGDEAIALLQEALTYTSTPCQRERMMLELAQCHFTQGHYAEAAQMWATIVDLSPECPIAENYLVALYHAGAYQDALQNAQRLRGAGVQRPLVIQIEAAVLEYIGDVKQAKVLYDQLSWLEPTNVAHRVHLACLAFRCGEREAARQALTQIHFAEIKEHPSLLIQVAQLRVMLGMGDVLPLVYQARRLDFGNPQTLLAYLSMFLGREEQDMAILTPCVIGIDCTVALQRGSETLRYTLLNEMTVPRDPSELAPTDALAQKLMGHHKGDQIIWESGLTDLTYEVIEVQSKYVAAFQETLKEFTPRFPDNHALHTVEVPENDLSKILTVIDAHHGQTTQLQTLYTRERWPLGTIASLAGCSLFDVWAGLVNQKDVRIFVAGGSPTERRQEKEMLTGSNEVVLDLTALLTLWHLGVHDRVARRFQKVFVAQAVLDDLNKELTWHYLHGKPSMVMGKEGDRYVYHKVSPETLSHRQYFFENLRHFIESNTEVVSVPYALEMGKEHFENMKDLFGDGASASVLVAKGRGIPLYADDWGLRQIAKNDWQVESIGSQTILAEMREGGHLTDNEYHEAVRWLVSANYDFVTLDHKDLLWILQQNAMQMREEVTRMFARLQEPECDEASAVLVLADLIKAVWLEPLTDDQKWLILDLALRTLTAGRVSQRVIANLLSYSRINSSFYLHSGENW
jgi:tetratricopeptide (TPR) repeat protein